MAAASAAFTPAGASSNGAWTARAASWAVVIVPPLPLATTTTGADVNSLRANVAVSALGVPSASTESVAESRPVREAGSWRAAGRLGQAAP